MKKKIPLQVYDCFVEFQLCTDIIKVYQRLAKKYKLTDEYDSLDGVFVNPGDMKRYHLLINASQLTHNVIAHEVYHTATQICELRCIAEEETRAWLAGYLTAEIYKFLQKKQQQVKHE